MNESERLARDICAARKEKPDEIVTTLTHTERQYFGYAPNLPCPRWELHEMQARRILMAPRMLEESD